MVINNCLLAESIDFNVDIFPVINIVPNYNSLLSKSRCFSSQSEQFSVKTWYFIGGVRGTYIRVRKLQAWGGTRVRFVLSHEGKLQIDRVCATGSNC